MRGGEMIEKVRRVDFSPDEWLGGTARLSDAECGIYIRACALIYSHGGPITRADLRDVCKGRGPRFQRGLDSLIGHGKLIALDAERLDQARCEAELARARRRIEAAKDGARSRWDSADQAEENSGPDVHERYTKGTRAVHERYTKLPREEAVSSETNVLVDAVAMPSLTGNAKRKKERFKNLKGPLGCPPRARALAHEAPPEPHSAEDKAAVDQIVAEVQEILRLPASGLRNGTYNPVAYREAISVTKRDTWLNNLATFAGEALPGLPEKMAAWEAIEAARNAGSRNATPPDIRRALDQLSRLRDQKLAYAEAAE